VLGLAVVAVVSSLVWAANLDLTHSGRRFPATTLALLLYGGMALAFFRDRLITVFAAIKSKR
jgi:hypothetical protein